MKKSTFLLSLSVLLLGLSSSREAKAQFTNDSVNNTVIRDTAQYYGSTSQIATAPNGKSFVIWSEPYNNGGYFRNKIRMQLIDKYGVPQWNNKGIVVDSMMGQTLYLDHLTIDKEGNAIYASQDVRSGQGIVKPVIYKFDQAGNPLWGANGIQLADTVDSPIGFSGGTTVCVTDNNNVVVTYYTEGSSRTYISYQKFSPAGTSLWASQQIIYQGNVAPIMKYERPQLISAGGENFIMVYVKRSGTYTYNLNAQKFDSQGNPIWANPTVVSTYNFPNYGFPSVSSDGYGGVFTTFQSGNPQNATIPDAFAQRIYADGHTWNTTGKELVGDASSVPTFRKFDGGSAFAKDNNSYFATVPMVSTANSFVQTVNVQKLDTAGNLLFTTAGNVVLPLSSGLSAQDVPTFNNMKQMDSGFAFIYSIGASPSPTSIYGTKLNYSGTLSWPFAPAAVSVNSSVKSRIMAGDFVNNQVIISWIDTRTVGAANNSSYSGGVYVQNLRMDGTRGIVCAHAALDSFASVHETDTAFALTGGTPAGGTYSGTGVSNGIFSPALAGVGTFTIKYVYNDGMCADSATRTITVLPSTSVSNIAQQELFECYPNPANGQFTVALKQNISGDISVKITSMDGRVIFTDKQNSNSYKKSFDLTGFAKGIYLVEVSSPKGTATAKLVLQ